MMNTDCFYCSKDHRLEQLMIPIHNLSISTLYLNRDQTHKGRCIVAMDEHRTELFHLNSEKLFQFMMDVSISAKAIQSACRADKINYAVYGDLVSHLHFHLVPKYEGGTSWGEAFVNNPATKKIWTEEEYDSLIEKIRQNL